RRTGKAAVRAVVRDSRLSSFQCVIGARSKVFRLRLRLRRGCVTLWRSSQPCCWAVRYEYGIPRHWQSALPARAGTAIGTAGAA
ncbi:MAG TPA: hypothetical protein PKW88_12585, partial [Plasticicumulans sp.]|nr:hypothetical protein [Plasticicumulans sp.]HMZ11545.1 hypothetical protein [Plasticicumulans sp.]HNJ09201.1 hypothetical protein [Plasticicumulans sp.]